MAVLTTEQLFSGALLAYMSELKGGQLKKFCEVSTQKGGESITFNRIKKAIGKDGLVSMFDTGFTGDAGDLEKIVVAIAEISAQDKVKESDMNKTSIDIKNSYVKALGNSVMVREDDKVIAAIVVEDLNLKSIGDIAAFLDVDAQVKLLIGAIRRAKAFAKGTVDNYKGVSLIINPEDWSLLSVSDYLLNGDYSAAFGGGVSGEPETFFGAEVLVTESAPTGTTYVMPSNTVCFGEWEGSTIADAVFVPTDMRRYHIQAVKSVGVKVAEAAMITKMISKPTV